MSQAEADPELLRTKINQETAKIPFKALQRFFAQGRLVVVSSELDLVEIAAMTAGDRAEDIGARMENGRVAKVSDVQAQRWIESDALLWTVVVKPWVFVQEPKPTAEQQLH